MPNEKPKPSWADIKDDEDDANFVEHKVDPTFSTLPRMKSKSPPKLSSPPVSPRASHPVSPHGSQSPRNVKEPTERKKLPCMNLIRNNQCIFGDACYFRHDVSKVQLGKCKFFERGNCERGNKCFFVHDTSAKTSSVKTSWRKKDPPRRASRHSSLEHHPSESQFVTTTNRFGMVCEHCGEYMLGEDQVTCACQE